MAIIQNVIAAGLHSALPAAAAGNEGHLYYEIDTQKLFRSNGSAWVQVAKGVVEGIDPTAVDVTGTFKLSADISPSQITSDQNDYNPTGLSTAATLRLSTDTSRNVTGLQGGADGRMVTIVNVGTNTLVLADEGSGSSAANRFALSGNIILAGDDGVILQYDSTSSRWRCIGKSPGAAGGAFGSLASDKKSRVSTDLTTTSTTFIDMDSALNITLTTGARRCMVVLNANGKIDNTGQLLVDVEIDGARAGQTDGLVIAGSSTNVNHNMGFTFITSVLSAGSHTFKPQFAKAGTGTATIYASASVTPIIFSVFELPLNDPI